MSMLEEYWTRDVPTEPGQYAVLHTDGCLEICDLDRARNIHGWPWGAGFCRLAPAAEVDRLKAENAKLRELVVDAYAEGEQDARTREGGWNESVTKSEMDRLQGRAE